MKPAPASAPFAFAMIGAVCAVVAYALFLTVGPPMPGPSMKPDWSPYVEFATLVIALTFAAPAAVEPFMTNDSVSDALPADTVFCDVALLLGWNVVRPAPLIVGTAAVSVSCVAL